MKCNYRNQFFLFVLFVSVVPSTFGRRSGGFGRSRSGGYGGGKSHSTSHTGTSNTGTSHTGASYPRQTYSSSHSSPSHPGTSHTGTSHTDTSSYPRQTYRTDTGYGWRTNTGANRYNPHTGYGHYYNSPSSSSTTNWGSSYHPPQNAFGTFHPVSSGIAPSYHFHRSTNYVPIYIPSSHTYIHRHNTNSDQSSTSTATNNVPPTPPSEPVVYKEDSSFGESSKPTMIVGFNNMIVYGVFENEKHYVITVSEDLDDDLDDIPERFLRTEESNLFEIVTLKPTTTTTTTEIVPTTNSTTTNEFSTVGIDFDVSTTSDTDWTTGWRSTTIKAPKDSTSIDKDTIGRKYSKSGDEDATHTSDGSKVDDDALNLYFGDMIL